MNIQCFKRQVSGLSWQEVKGVVGTSRVRYLLPYVEDKMGDGQNYPDLRGAQIISHWWVNDRVEPKSPGRCVWSGEVIHTRNRELRHYVILLELATSHKQIGETWFSGIVFTPPGRPGNPATLLIDKDGRIVPELWWFAGMQVRVYFLDHNFSEFGWNLLYPAIGLQFVEGVCTLPSWRLALWDTFLKRHTC